jgi:hypothetical protein
MRLFKGMPGRLVVPAALAAVLIAALVVSPAIGGPNFLTAKKANKKIANKTNATELRVNGSHKSGDTFNIAAPDSLIATLSGLNAGSYVVTTTFTLTRDQSSLVVNCQLSAGSGTDKSNSFGGGGTTVQDNVSMSVTSGIPAGGSAQLRCADGSAGTDATLRNIEITAVKVPKSKVTTVN